MQKEDSLNFSMFKSYDIRTKEDNLDSKALRRLLDATALYIKEVVPSGRVVLGHDARLGVPALLEEAVSLFPVYGIDIVVNPLTVSTPQFYYGAMQNRTSAGIMFTASHNPGNYVGMKILLPSMVSVSYGSGPGGGIRRIKELYVEGKAPSVEKSRGRIMIKSYLDEYIDYSLTLSGAEEGSLSGLKVLCDFLSGAAGCEITQALSYAGADIKPLHLIPDGRFPSGDPNPIILSSIESAKREMMNADYDMGLLFDGDGDRMDVMMPSSMQLAPSFNFSILIKEIASLYKNMFPSIKTYADIKANPIAVKAQSKLSDVGLIRNGHSFIKETLSREAGEGCVAAAEESGHYYMNFPYDIDDFSSGFAATENTLFFALLTARMMKERPELYKKALEEEERTVREREWTLHFRDHDTMDLVQDNIRRELTRTGFSSYDTSYDGKCLDALLFRYNLPLKITPDTPLDGEWVQVVQRESRSEDNVLRWEITGSDENAVRKVKSIVDDSLKDYS